VPTVILRRRLAGAAHLQRHQVPLVVGVARIDGRPLAHVIRREDARHVGHRSPHQSLVGGIVVLIIFSIFLTQKAGEEMAQPLRSRTIFSILSVLLGFALAYSLIYQYDFKSRSTNELQVNVADIGHQMLTTTGNGYVLPFEVVSMLLLAAMIGCIVIAMKAKPKE